MQARSMSNFNSWHDLSYYFKLSYKLILQQKATRANICTFCRHVLTNKKENLEMYVCVLCGCQETLYVPY